MSSHNVAHTERPQGADSFPEAVGILGQQHQVLSLHSCHNRACGLRETPVQKLAHVPHPRHIERSFISCSPVGEACFRTRAVW